MTSVTLSPPCSVCGAPLQERRSHASYCSSPCRQRAYRRRHHETVTQDPRRLSFEEREALRAEIDRRCRAVRAEADRREAERLLAMFADETGAA